MSWRAGGKLFWDIWPQVKTAIPDLEWRRGFVLSLITLFLDNDVDAGDLRGGDPEVDALIDELDPEI